MMMDGAEIPPFFLCPISLQLMKDPVTLSTGVTYDRPNIDRWLAAHPTCPVTNLHLSDCSLTPNATLRRLILSWSTSTTFLLPHPSVPVVDDGVLRRIHKELTEPHPQSKTLHEIKKLIQDNEDYKGCMEERGITFLVAAVAAKSRPSSLADEAITLLHFMNPSPPTLKKLSERNNAELISVLSTTVQKDSYRARVHAVLLLEAAIKSVDDTLKTHLPSILFDGLIEILKDQNSDRSTTMAALSILLHAVPHGRNRTKAVESGAVAVLVELLVEEKDDKRKCEAMLGVLASLCGRAEGRAELVEHPAGIAAVAGKVLQVSRASTERAMKVLLLVCRNCGGGGRMVEEMVVVGAVEKVLMVLQVEHRGKARDMAKEILGLHLHRWSRFPCFPSDCYSSPNLNALIPLMAD